MLCCCNLFRMLSQSVSNEMAIRSQCFGNPSAAVGVRFIVPAYMKTPTKWRTDMCVRLCGNVCAIMCIHIFDYVRIRARWIGPYAWRNVRNPFRGWALVFHGMFVGILRSVLCVFRWRTCFFHGVFATLSQTVSSRRGRFIVPAYMKTPTKWQTDMCVWWCGNVRAVKRKHVFDDVNISIW